MNLTGAGDVFRNGGCDELEIGVSFLLKNAYTGLGRIRTARKV